MQRYHRTRHRVIWVVLFPFAILLILIAVVSRPQWPTMDHLPGEANQSGVAEIQD